MTVHIEVSVGSVLGVAIVFTRTYSFESFMRESFMIF